MRGITIIDWRVGGPLRTIEDMNTGRRSATVGNLFDLLLAPVTHGELEVADLLGIGVEPLRDRMKDLRKRGLIAGPFRDPTGVRWKIRFSTGVQARAAARRSGLNPDASVTIGLSFWRGLGRETKQVAAAMSNRVRRWLSPRSAE
jgi:hypothetical protein